MDRTAQIRPGQVAGDERRAGRAGVGQVGAAQQAALEPSTIETSTSELRAGEILTDVRDRFGARLGCLRVVQGLLLLGVLLHEGQLWPFRGVLDVEDALGERLREFGSHVDVGAVLFGDVVTVDGLFGEGERQRCLPRLIGLGEDPDTEVFGDLLSGASILEDADGGGGDLQHGMFRGSGTWCLHRTSVTGGAQRARHGRMGAAVVTKRYVDGDQARMKVSGAPGSRAGLRRRTGSVWPLARRCMIDPRATLRSTTEVAGSNYLEVAGWSEFVDHLGDVEVVAIAPSLARAQAHLVAALEERGARVVIPDGEDPAAQVADVPVGVTWAEMAIAETGSLLISEHELGDRVVTMLCRRLVQLVDADAIGARLEAAAGWMQSRAGQPGFASLMTGPSRTADIERSLTIGVQGPDEVDVVVLLDTEVHADAGADSTSEVSA